jgi:hypothetical protein
LPNGHGFSEIRKAPGRSRTWPSFVNLMRQRLGKTKMASFLAGTKPFWQRTEWE